MDEGLGERLLKTVAGRSDATETDSKEKLQIFLHKLRREEPATFALIEAEQCISSPMSFAGLMGEPLPAGSPARLHVRRGRSGGLAHAHLNTNTPPRVERSPKRRKGSAAQDQENTVPSSHATQAPLAAHEFAEEVAAPSSPPLACLSPSPPATVRGDAACEAPAHDAEEAEAESGYDSEAEEVD